MLINRRTLTLVAVLVVASSFVYADSYHQVSFTGNVSFIRSGFSAGLVRAPGTISGSFVYDDNLIPGPGTGFVNVPFSAFPDIDKIPDATAFNMVMSPSLSFTLSDALFFFPTQEAFIQYNNGVFKGFAYFAQFELNGQTYEFDDQGGSWTIFDAPGGVNNFHSEASGSGFTLGTPSVYTPPSTVPEPASLALLGSGLAAFGIRFRRRR